TCTVADGVSVMVPADSTVTVAFSCTFAGTPEMTGTNTAIVNWASQLPTPTSSAEDTIDVTASEAGTPVNRTVTVRDDNGTPDDVSDDVELGPVEWTGEGTTTSF